MSNCRLQFFSQISFPLAPEYPIGTIFTKFVGIFAALWITAISCSPVSTNPAIYYCQCCIAEIIFFVSSSEPQIRIAAPHLAPAPSPARLRIVLVYLHLENNNLGYFASSPPPPGGGVGFVGGVFLGVGVWGCLGAGCGL